MFSLDFAYHRVFCTWSLDRYYWWIKSNSQIVHEILQTSCNFQVSCFNAECDIRMDFDTNEYQNIFISRKCHERISEYIRMKFFWHERISEYISIKILIGTNIRINIRIKNIWIFEYISHTLNYTGTSSVLLQSK